MENASKALLIAGGIFIALLVLGAFLLMWNQVSDYESSLSSSEKTSQLAKFNTEFVKYTYNDIYGYELISLINKVVDYNESRGSSESIKSDLGNDFQYQKMTIEVGNFGNFKVRYGTNKKTVLITDNSYTITDKNSPLYKKIDEYRTLEKDKGLDTLSQASANYDNIVTYESMKRAGKSVAEIQAEIGKTTYEFITKKISGLTTADIEKYREYSELKKSKFATDGEVEYYSNGQIKQIKFKFLE